LNILVVDDEKAVTSSVRVVLKALGHVVDVLHDGDEALEMLLESPDQYQILITDHHMCRLSGLQLLQGLQGGAFKGKVAVLSGYLTADLESQYRSLGADKILRKPFELDELRNAVEELSNYRQ